MIYQIHAHEEWCGCEWFKRDCSTHQYDVSAIAGELGIVLLCRCEERNMMIGDKSAGAKCFVLGDLKYTCIFDKSMYGDEVSHYSINCKLS